MTGHPRGDPSDRDAAEGREHQASGRRDNDLTG